MNVKDLTTRKHLKPILNSSLDTLKQFISDLEVQRKDSESFEEQVDASGTVTHIGITGHVSGSLQYEMEQSTALNIAGEMYPGELNDFNDDAKAAIREIANISAGNAVTKIKSEYDGVEIDITPPSLFVGDHIQLSNNVSTSPIRIPLRTNYGDIVLDVALEIN